LIEKNGVGSLINEFTRQDYFDALKDVELLGTIDDACRTVAAREFDLTNVGGHRYRRLYRALLESSG
jgi:hypothetical protein